MKKTYPYIIVLFILTFFVPFSASSENIHKIPEEKTKRYALLIGNSDYKNQAGLKTPVNDVRDMAEVLQELGFHVVKIENADLKEMEDAIRNMGECLRKSGQGTVGLLFFRVRNTVG